ncbi:MAG: nucleotidyl transferase AbiEii/AbiGii toxin family protein [Anaerolineales bacterium]|nr:nucleotidyl transferase AbiEii/AbiGii toxin family protein [Anaerolineales bacterium]
MKALLRELIAPAETNLRAIHTIREYLQARVLQSLQRAGAMQSLAFHGGTSLRFLYDIPRYSEDLDFALELQPELYDFRGYLEQIVKDFSTEAYGIDVKLNQRRIVNKAFIRFRGLLHELGLSAHKDEVLAIKIEVDTRPPAGAGLTATPLNRFVPLNLLHHDPATLLAGKLHAVLQRDYLKGRDIYDLWWYLNQPDWPPPNLIHLNENLQQGGWKKKPLQPETWHRAIHQRLTDASWPLIKDDVDPFIIPTADQPEFSRENLLGKLQ